ncbi:MAG: PQQ-binding-like beta-propeller repeat protein [Gemmatales bacterium]
MLPRYQPVAWRHLIGMGCLLSSFTLGFVAAQQPPQKAAPPIQMNAGLLQLNGQIVIGPQGVDTNKETGSQKVKLPVDPRARRKVEEARRFIDTQDWQSAVKILQSLLDASEDNFLQESEGDKGRRVSVRAEANRMLGNLPPEGKRFYEQQFGSVAKLALKQARAQANPQAMAEVALKYVHTQAGAEAAAWLGAYHLDHGRYIVAALCFERLLSREQAGTELTISTIYKAAIAFERAGDVNNRERAWKMLQARLNQPNERLPVALRSWDEARLKASLSSIAQARVQDSQTDWRLFMGSADRTARSNSTSPFMEPMFPSLSLTEPGSTRNEIEQTSKKLTSWGVPIIPGSHPIIVKNHAIFRTLEGITAFNLKTGVKAWDSQSDASLAASMRGQNNVDPESINYLSYYRDTAPSIIVENTLLGTLSADNELVYAVEDLALPPYVSITGMMWRGAGANQPRNRHGDFHACNHLIAYDIEGGRAVWSIGTKLPEQPFSDMYFLGPPLPLGDKLYVLAEVQAEIKLLCLQNIKTMKPGAGQTDEFEYNVELVWLQPLGVVDRRITEEPVRRSQAAMLSYSDGILVCPTNAGAVVGVDLLTRSLVWAFNYQHETVRTDSNEADRPGGINGRIIGRLPPSTEAPTRGAQWSFAAPVVSQGKVLLAPPDGNALHAINLRDGTVAWSVNRVDTSKDALPPDYYLGGVFDQTVVLVGKQNVHALDLKTGNKLWNVNTGIPVGRGIANNDTYFLPVKSNEVVGINLKSGAITSRSKARHREQLGNLALVGEHLVSLNHLHLLVYPIEAVKERQVAERLKTNPNDAGALIDQGELHWQRGNVAVAIDHFRRALKNNPPSDLQAKGEAKLADSLLILLEKNFIEHEKDLPELERLTVASATTPEERLALEERKARYYRLVARGRESQGRVEEALASYHAFAQLDDKLIPSPDDVQVRIVPRVWALAQAQGMVKRLSPEMLTKLDAIVLKQWEQVKGGSLEAIRAFTDFYGELGTVGQKAQLQFVEMQLESKDFTSAVLRLMPLLHVSNIEIAARAHEAMARANIRLGEMENAAYYYRMLARKYPNVEVRAGKTGKQLLQELSTDKRFLPYLDERQGLSNLQNFSIDKMDYSQRQQIGYSRQSIGMFTATFSAREEVPPSLRRYSLEVNTDNNNPTLNCNYILRDLITKKDLQKPRFATAITGFYGLPQESVLPTYQMCGNVMVFAWADAVVGIDPVRKKELWAINVTGDDKQDVNQREGRILPVNEIPGRFKLQNNNNTFEILGTYGPGSSNRLLLTVRLEGLICIDPQTGDKLWTRFGINPGMEMFGDDEYAILLPPAVGRSVEDKPMAIRLLDGEMIELPNEIIEQKKSAVAVMGRKLLVQHATSATTVEWQLLDPVTRQCQWKKSLARDGTILRAALPSELIGYLDREGKAQLFNLQTGNLELETRLSQSNSGFAQAHFLLDDKECYIFCCTGLEQTREKGRFLMLTQYQWLRSVPVQGPVACVNMDNGKLLWEEQFPLQYVVVHRFRELPFLLCSAVLRKMQEGEKPLNVPNANFLRVRSEYGIQTELQCFSKLTGKAIVVQDKPEMEPFSGRVYNNVGFQELLIEHHTGRIELRSPSQSLSFVILANALAAVKNK